MAFSLDDPLDSINEKCAVFGTYGTGEDSAKLAFYGLSALQHRAQESSGIVSADGRTLYRHAGSGLVASVYREEDLQRLPGGITIGHNRYTTSGSADDETYIQPFWDKKIKLAFAHNGNLPTTDKLEAFLDKRGVSTARLNDSGMMMAAISWHIQQGSSLEDAVKQAYPLFEGAFSCVAMTPDKLVAFRDRCGIRPLSIGKLDEGFVVASETCAFDIIGAKFLRNVKPGELVVMDADGLASHQIVRGNLKLDIFELVYYARPDSIVEGCSVDQVRQNFGRELAKEWKIDADVVVPVPDSAIPAAIGYSQASGIPFEMALIKNRYIHRTFIRPNAQLREHDLKMKLNPMPHLLKGKRVILVDDSIVRGTTSRKIASMIYEAGAREVHLLISSPPIRYPDFYGIDLPSQEELIGYRLTPEEIRVQLGVDSLCYLSFDGMIRATGKPASKFSTHCFDGVYPISIGTREEEITTPIFALATT